MEMRDDKSIKDDVNYSKYLSKLYEDRNKIILADRKILQTSKNAIFALHRDDIDGFETHLSNSLADLKSIDQYLTGCNEYLYRKEISQAIQETVEAIAFEYYVLEKKLIEKSEIEKKVKFHVSDEDYILGILDFTGELMKFCIGNLTEEKTVGVDGVSGTVGETGMDGMVGGSIAGITSIPGAGMARAGGSMADTAALDGMSERRMAERQLNHTARMKPEEHTNNIQTPILTISKTACEISLFMTRLYNTFIVFEPSFRSVRSFDQKLQVFRTSLEKIQNAIFNVQLRNRRFN